MPSNFQISISTESISSFEARLELDERFGADIRFLGVVRSLEEGKHLKGIDYSCYEPMALQELRKLCQEMQEGNVEHRVLIHHQIGFVASAEPSIVIRVQTAHSKEGFALCHEYLKRIKTSVPIWKEVVLS